jgi:hypothetical protein
MEDCILFFFYFFSIVGNDCMYIHRSLKKYRLRGSLLSTVNCVGNAISTSYLHCLLRSLCIKMYRKNYLHI